MNKTKNRPTQTAGNREQADVSAGREPGRLRRGEGRSLSGRKLKNYIFLGICGGALLCALALLVFLLGIIAWNGLGALSHDFLLSPSRNFGAGGGIFYQILGSLLLVGVAALLSLPVALGTAIYKSEYLHNPTGHKICQLMLYGLNAVPSIIFGIFGLVFFVNFLGTGISWFVGSVILSGMALPTITLSSYQSLRAVPEIYRESGLALGLTKWSVIRRVLMPRAMKGALTGLFIALARAIGETAPIMFIATAFSGVETPDSLFEPVATLPTHILTLAQQAVNPRALENAWGAAFVLLCLVLLFSVSALYLRLRGETPR